MPRKKVAPSQTVDIFKQGQPGQVMLVESQYSDGSLVMNSGERRDSQDITVGRYQQVIVPAEWAATSRDLKSAFQKNLITISWVDANTSPRIIPTPDDAPDEIKGDLNRLELLFAQDSIVLQKDENLAITAVKTIVHQPEPRDRMVDVRYMTERFRQVLRLADWLEERMWNRKRVRAAIQESTKAISNL